MRIPPALPKPAELFLALAVFFFLRASPAPEDVDCSPATCGSGPSVRFPFWITDRHSPYCGLPSFKLSCKDQAPAIRIFSTDYLIRNISYSEQTMDVSVPGRAYNTCQPLPRDFNFYSTPFSLLSYPSNLFFYLNCSVDSIPEGYRQIECPSVGKSFVGWSESNASATCESNFSFPSAAPRDIDLGNFSEVASYGFLLRWRAVNCSECLHSGGECRFDVKENRFACRCGDVFRRDSCGEKRKWKKILIGVGAGAGGVVLASLFCLFFYRRQQVERQAVNSKLLSLTASSDRSSRKDLEDGGDTTGAPFFRYEELHEATSGFCPSNELGDGGFGTVYKGKLRDGRVVAVKRLYENNFKRVEQFLNEAAILNRLRHPNLVSLYGCTSRHSRELLLVYEYIPNGTVADHLHGDLAPQRALPWSVRLRIAAETASALAYLHSTAPPIIHRDVKTNNILLDSGFHVKVADFGLSRLFPLDVTHISTAPQGTPGYVDPEYHQCYQLTDKSDVYSFGVVLVELISSKPAVDITRRRNEINLSSMAISMIQRGKLGEFVDQDLGFEADPEVRRTVKVVAELAFRCLQTEKEMRPTMEDALEVLRATMGGKEGETEVVQPVKKIEEVSLLKAIMPPRSPNSVMHNWSSQTTTPNASG